LGSIIILYLLLQRTLAHVSSEPWCVLSQANYAFSSPSAPRRLYYLAECCCEKEMLKVCLAQCLNLLLIGFGYIKDLLDWLFSTHFLVLLFDFWFLFYSCYTITFFSGPRVANHRLEYFLHLLSGEPQNQLFPVSSYPAVLLIAVIVAVQILQVILCQWAAATE